MAQSVTARNINTHLPAKKRKNSGAGILKRMVKTWQLYVFVLPVLVYLLLFRYIPIYGLQIAFKEYMAIKGFWGSPWVGLEHFNRFFNSAVIWDVLRNTVYISMSSLIFGFPIPVIFALLLNHVKSVSFKRTVQTVTYAPYFISSVVLVGIIYTMLSPRNGVINQLISMMGFERKFFMAEPTLFTPIYVISGIWQQTGWSSIIYIAALSGINPELYEAAIVDGANKIQRIFHIDIPGIMPTIIIMFILNAGSLLSVGFEKTFLMQNGMNLGFSEVIATFVYKQGLIRGEFSYATAIGLFESVINFVILILVNRVAKKYSEISLW